MRACWCAVPLLWLAAVVHAQDSRAAYLGFFDRDGDGRVSEAEYVQYMSRGFARMDANGDGVLETDELPGRRGEPISLEAFQDNLRHQFHRLDRNHDGSLDAGELTAPPR
ncbi:hypothetical protein [Rhodanobacter lindaniclasticus]|uniref:hypothetical protein n=1 Tax=Rhodanobacter lindaniclasticus TaxID=75310 RepID=UPI001FE76A65|nr:hypothetical protein [Rhodanobacter lindaniclasticus]